MSELPPNLEDGEFWLPSDVLHEIQSTNTQDENRSNYSFKDALCHPVRAVASPRICAANSFPNVAIDFKQGELMNLRGQACFPGLRVNRRPINISAGKYRGTGVFIPKPTTTWKELDVKMIKGGRNRPSYQGHGMTQKVYLRKQVPESPLISTQIIQFPDDRTYESH